MELDLSASSTQILIDPQFEYMGQCFHGVGDEIGNLGCRATYDIHPKHTINSNLAKYRSYITSFKSSNLLDILHRARQYHCRFLCKISKRLDHWIMVERDFAGFEFKMIFGRYAAPPGPWQQSVEYPSWNEISRNLVRPCNQVQSTIPFAMYIISKISQCLMVCAITLILMPRGLTKIGSNNGLSPPCR